MATVNIGASNAGDQFYRYKMPAIQSKIEGRGNGIKTNIPNMVDVAKALARPPTYTTKYMGYELGALTKCDEKSGTYIVNGAHSAQVLAQHLEGFIKRFVQCHSCGNPETVINITKKDTIQLKCKACGFVSDVDMRHKLTTFILKNPPEKDKAASKKDKQLRRAEKEREEEGAELDRQAEEERRRKKAEKKEKKEGKSKKEKKEKKSKKDAKKHGKATEPEFGARGFIRETDKYDKEGEFRAWLGEVKKRDMESLQKWEEKELFKEYAEDYNTATLPHEKFYNLEKWSREEAARRAREDPTAASTTAAIERESFNDEEERKREIQAERERRDAEYKRETYLRMKSDSSDLENLREQERLKELRKNAYNMGDMETVARVNKILAPDEPDAGR
mmetsp:Transcript_3687/g.16199  ORF Transcript_3687/g.16199 Transcript_3687/m.16199 type:complete len:391 (-) Transcript_3687:42-1214(-)